MAGGKKKKSKAVNPNRGFATTSLPKAAPKVEEVKEEATSTETSTPDTAPTSVSATNGSSVAGHARELNELSAEELEAQLEASELQQFVEQHAAKVQKETNRLVSRLKADRRVLRSQAEPLPNNWISDELVQEIIELTLAEETATNTAIEADALPKLWILSSCLLELGISQERVDEVLQHSLCYPPIDSSSTTWSLNDALDWLSLRCDLEELGEYDVEKHVTFAEEAEPEEAEPPPASTPPEVVEVSTEEESEVSDLGSDPEQEELLGAYLRTKARLFKKESGSSKKKGGVQKNQSATSKKLVQKIRRIESDMLFDLPHAEAQWSAQRAELMKEAAEQKKEAAEQKKEAAEQKKLENQKLSIENTNGTAPKEEQSEDDVEMLGGVFESLPGPSKAVSADDTPVTVRDFGRLTSIGPKRVLEETCKARDPSVKISYKQISPTVWSCRHSVTISWTRARPLIGSDYLPNVEIQSKNNTVTISMVREATPDVAQSEAYIATVALYVQFDGSTKEGKAHLRLPSAFRGLWDDLNKSKQEHRDAMDRETVKALRQLIEENKPMDDDDDEEIVYTPASRWRNASESGAATPASAPDMQDSSHIADNMKQIWARKSSTPAYRDMLPGRMKLPIYDQKQALMAAIDRNQVTILVSETGSGKSTQLPAYILEHELSQGRTCKVYCTEPRRISAISLAQRVSEELGEGRNDLGTMRSLVGYAIRLESKVTPWTMLVYATVGVVLRMLESSNGLEDVTHLVVDEVHERGIETDFLLIILRSLMLRRPELKVVLMSATVDAQTFSNYLGGAQIFSVPGRMYPVQEYFLEDAIEMTNHTPEDGSEETADQERSDTGQLVGYSKRTVDILQHYNEFDFDYTLITSLVHRIATDPQLHQYSNAILIFCPGIAEIKRLYNMFTTDRAPPGSWRVHALHSTFSTQDQQSTFSLPPAGTRKLILATNIAETGITIPDITCVIDSGKHKEMRYDERRQLSRLITSFIARANSKQRRGRAGRVQPGLCIHLFTKHRHDTLLPESPIPEMLRLSLQDLVMRVKINKLGSIEDVFSQALDPPTNKNVRRAIDALIEVDALTSSEELTPLGRQLARLPVDAQVGKLILLGTILSCADFAVTCAAILSSKAPFVTPMHEKQRAEAARLAFRRGDSDLLTAYTAYLAWRKACQTPGVSEIAFCRRNFLSPQNLSAIEDLKHQLLNTLVMNELITGPRQRSSKRFVDVPGEYARNDGNDAVIQAVVTWAFYPKIARREGNGWRSLGGGQMVGMHPHSVNRNAGAVRLVTFYGVMQGTGRRVHALETTGVNEVGLVVMGGSAVCHAYAGVVVLDGNRVRYKVREWRGLIVIKVLRMRVREVIGMVCKGKKLTQRQERWLGVVGRVLEGAGG